MVLKNKSNAVKTNEWDIYGGKVNAIDIGQLLQHVFMCRFNESKWA